MQSIEKAQFDRQHQGNPVSIELLLKFTQPKSDEKSWAKGCQSLKRMEMLETGECDEF